MALTGTRLQRAGKIADPLRDTNFKNTTMWNGQRWVYAKTFSWPAPALQFRSSADAEVLLVFEGVKMGAGISL